MVSTHELGELIKLLSRKYGYNDVPIGCVHDQLRELHVELLKNSIIENSQWILEMYLRDLIMRKDPNNLGKLPPEQVMHAIEDSDRVKLSRLQKYVVRSALQTDDYGMVQYKPQTRLLAEVVRVLFAH